MKLYRYLIPLSITLVIYSAVFLYLSLHPSRFVGDTAHLLSRIPLALNPVFLFPVAILLFLVGVVDKRRDKNEPRRSFLGVLLLTGFVLIGLVIGTLTVMFLGLRGLQ